MSAFPPELKFASHLIRRYQSVRYERGIAQLALDDKVGLTLGQIAKWESGARKPTLYNAFCWAEALGCELKLVKKTTAKMEKQNETKQIQSVEDLPLFQLRS